MPSRKLIASKTAPGAFLAGNSVQIDMTALDPPPWIGFANRFALRDHDRMLELTFWELDAERAIAAARFHVPNSDLSTHIWELFGPYRDRLGNALAGVMRDRYHEELAAVRPEGIAPVVNIMAMSHAGDNAILSCYHMSPKTVADRRTLRVDPVFSLSVPPLLMLTLLEALAVRVRILRRSVGFEADQ